MQIYEVVKKTENGTTSYGYYRYESAAKRVAAQYEQGRISRLAHEIARLVGWKRGKNSERFQEIITELGTPEYVVKTVTVNNNYR